MSLQKYAIVSVCVNACGHSLRFATDIHWYVMDAFDSKKCFASSDNSQIMSSQCVAHTQVSKNVFLFCANENSINNRQK